MRKDVMISRAVTICGQKDATNIASQSVNFHVRSTHKICSFTPSQEKFSTKRMSLSAKSVSLSTFLISNVSTLKNFLTKPKCWKADYYPLPEIYPWISSVFVTEEYRGHRISEKLINFANVYAKEVGFIRTYIPSEHKNMFFYFFPRKVFNKTNEFVCQIGISIDFPYLNHQI